MAQDLGGPRPVPPAAQQPRQRDARFVVAFVEGDEGAVVRDGRRRVALLLPDAAQEPVRAVRAAVLGEELERDLEVLRGLGAATVPEQGVPESHAGHEAAGVAPDGGLQRGNVGDPEIRQSRDLRNLCRLLAHRCNRRRESLLQEVLEVVVEVLQAHPQRPLERLLVRRAVAVRVQHGHDGGEPVPCLDHLEDQRRLVVAVPHLARVARAGKPPVQLADRPQLVQSQRCDEAHAGLMAPAAVRLALFVHGQPLGEPPRYLAVRHPDVEGVRDLVPER